MTALLTPSCPLCSQGPWYMLGGGTQMVCATRGCKVFMWNGLKTMDENLTEINFIDLSGWAQ